MHKSFLTNQGQSKMCWNKSKNSSERNIVASFLHQMVEKYG